MLPNVSRQLVIKQTYFIRRKKLSNFSHSDDWARDSNNFVAKSYIDQEVERETYFNDVKLQMDAKLWGEEYNRHNPPKKVKLILKEEVFKLRL